MKKLLHQSPTQNMSTATELSLPLHEWSAAALVAAYRCRALSPVEVAESALRHMAVWEPHIQASYLLRPEQTLASARASEARWQKLAPLSPLDGVPVTLKDNIATQGDPSPLGTLATDGTPARADAPPAARLREAGTVLLCKTTMPDYGMLSSGVSSFHPLARNPWDTRKTPGGSSAGAAAAAAAGYGPLHLGIDIGGSLRLPASWCGIFSLKPSLGRIPIDPPYTGRAAGPMTRSVADAAQMMRALCWPDERDSMSLPFAAIDWDNWDTPLSHIDGVRIGLLLDAGCGLAVDPEVQSAVLRAAQLLESAGASVTPMQPFLTRQMLDGMDHTWRMRSHLELAALPEARRASVLPYIRAWADSAAHMSGSAVFQASSQFHATRVATVAACNAFDYVISPTAPVLAFAAELPSPTNDPLHPLEHIAFTVPFNMSEQPAASINCGYSHSGLPIGLQIAGRRFDDLGVLQLSRAFEILRGPQRPWPVPPTVAA
jgi:aspartyl-tRNA(Asn)/glutamyl-tRNA(Gln) amidotransferase subunit A